MKETTFTRLKQVSLKHKVTDEGTKVMKYGIHKARVTDKEAKDKKNERNDIYQIEAS